MHHTLGGLKIAIAGRSNVTDDWSLLIGNSVPDVSIRVVMSRSESEVSAASAEAHLAVADGGDQSLDDVRHLFDASIATDDDLTTLVDRTNGFAARLKGHQLPPDLPPVIVPSCPTWEAAATRAMARIENVFAAGGVEATVEHIGSTAVPGLPAKDIIDLQVGLRRLDETCDDGLRLSGLVNVQELVPDAPGVSADSPRGGDEQPAEWAKRLYASVDEHQRVIVHVRRIGAANWRYALLFRDWLRANPNERDEYAAAKSELARAHSGDAHFDNYARAKNFWFDYAYQRSEEWASRTHWKPDERVALDD